jgi:hypothetical protein
VLLLSLISVGEGSYQASNNSEIFPEIPITEMIPTVVERAWQVGSFQALAEWENAITHSFKNQ